MFKLDSQILFFSFTTGADIKKITSTLNAENMNKYKLDNDSTKIQTEFLSTEHFAIKGYIKKPSYSNTELVAKPASQYVSYSVYVIDSALLDDTIEKKALFKKLAPHSDNSALFEQKIRNEIGIKIIKESQDPRTNKIKVIQLNRNNIL